MFSLQTLTEEGFALLTLLLLAGLMGVLMSLLFGAPLEGALQDNPVEKVMWLGTYLGTFFLLLLRYKRVLYATTRNKFMWLLIGLLVALALVYVVLSAAPRAAVITSIALAGTTLFGGYVDIRYGLREQLLLLVWVMSIMAVFGLL